MYQLRRFGGRNIVIGVGIFWGVWFLILWNYNIQNTHHELAELQQRLKKISDLSMQFTQDIDNKKNQWVQDEMEMESYKSQFAKLKQQYQYIFIICLSPHAKSIGDRKYHYFIYFFVGRSIGSSCFSAGLRRHSHISTATK